MAMIVCPECGKEVSDKAVACPNCGAPINVLTEIEIRFIRPKKLLCALISGNVYINDSFVGQLHNGGSFSTWLLPGIYRMAIEPVGPGVLTYGNLEIPGDANSVEVTVVVGKRGFDIGDIKYL